MYYSNNNRPTAPLPTPMWRWTLNASSRIGVFLLGLYLMSCSSESPGFIGLFNVDSTLQRQINHLIEHKAVIDKKVALNGVEKNTTVSPGDSIDWNEELAIFFELNAVNKPSSRGEYRIENYADDKSNLNVKAFTTTEELPVKFLKLYYHQSLGNLRKIEAEYNEENALYSSKRMLTLEFENIFDQTILTSYAVSGGQKMFLDDSVQYTIRAHISLKK